MTPITTDVDHDTATAELSDLIASWRRHLVAQRMSPATRESDDGQREHSRPDRCPSAVN